MTSSIESEVIRYFENHGDTEQNNGEIRFITISKGSNAEVYYEALKITAELTKQQAERRVLLERISGIHNLASEQIIRIRVKIVR